MADNKKKVLIVDDEESILEVLDLLLKKHGFKTYTANSGMHAIHQIVQNRPDIILLDVMMPGTTGISVHNELTQSHRIPVLFVTALSFERVREDLPSIKETDVVTKPWDDEKLVALIKSKVGL